MGTKFPGWAAEREAGESPAQAELRHRFAAEFARQLSELPVCAVCHQHIGTLPDGRFGEHQDESGLAWCPGSGELPGSQS